MKLYLFGGAEIDIPSRSAALLKNLIKEALISINPESVLLVPFARPVPHEEVWKEGWFAEMMSDTGIKILDARIETDINSVSNSAIFINGGIERRELLQSVNDRPQLLHLITHAQYIVAESAGSMAMGEYMRADRDGTEIVKGFGILRNTIIEPHYAEKQRQQLLIEDMEKSGMNYGIGIDSATGIIVDPTEFPTQWAKVGFGNIDLKQSKEQ